MAKQTLPVMMPSLQTDYNQEAKDGKVVMPQASEQSHDVQKSSSSSPPVGAADMQSSSAPHAGNHTAMQTASSPGVRTHTDMQSSPSCIIQHVPTEQSSCNWRVPPKKRVEIDAENRIEPALKGTKFGEKIYTLKLVTFCPEGFKFSK